jgi:hypothetical protein
MRFIKAAVAAVLASAVAAANAASVLDTGTTTSITAGFTDMKDTILALLGVAWPFLISVPVVLQAPRIVGGFVKMIARH